jgi:hypothetical protein
MAIAQASRKRKRKKRKKKHPSSAPPSPPPVQGVAPAPAPGQPATYRWITGWDDSRHDGLVRAIDDGQDHSTPQDPNTLPAKPLPQPQDPPAPKSAQGMGVYSGPFGRVEAARLLNRAGFGPRPGEAEALAEQGLQAAVYSLTRPSGSANLSGPAPTDSDGYPIAPLDSWGHDHLWWLDRMLRSDQPLVERMALVFHDWFATSNDKVGAPQLMIDQSNLFRNGCFGSFQTLLESVTIDPAMLLWLDGVYNKRSSINENYAREVMELFTLGADRGAYAETDVRELARAFTGWTYDWSNELGPHNFRYVSTRHDNNTKSVFSYPPFNVAPGNWTWQDGVRLLVQHPLHPSFFVNKLWSYFIPQAPSAGTLDALVSLYTSGSYAIRPLLEAILMHPDFYEGPAMVKPPIVYLASLMRASGTYIHDEQWVWLGGLAGQQLFYPPNVAGWDDNRWLDTNTLRGRWLITTSVLDDHHVDPWNGSYSSTEQPEPALDTALAMWNYPPLRKEQQNEILRFSGAAFPGSLAGWQQIAYRALRQNALRQLIAVSPDLQLS